MSQNKRPCKAFSLIELLVVMAIIALLISILIPALSSAREAGRNVSCLSNLHQFGVSLNSFSTDHKEHLPGIYTWNTENLEPWQRDWLSGTHSPFVNPNMIGINGNNYYNNSPQNGTMYEYVGNYKSYRCPSLAIGVLGSGVGSNGKYDYTLIGGFGGAKIRELPDRLYRLNEEDTGLNNNPYTRTLPFMVEESPMYHLNSTAIRGAFATTDQINNHHSKNSNYASPDGSASRFSNEFANITGNEMFAPGKGYRYDSGVSVGVAPNTFDMWEWLNLQ